MTEAPDPFAPQPTAPKKTGAGCSRPLLVGCGLLLVLLGIGAVVLALNASKLASWFYQKLEEQVVAHLPEDLPVADRERLERAFDDIQQSMQDGTLDPRKLREAQTKMTGMVQEPSKITAEDVRELSALLEAASGRAPTDAEDGGPPGG